MAPKIPQAPWHVSYHDGSNNGFSVDQEVSGGEVSATYSPVKPAESSSGTYSGGEPWKGTISTLQTEELWRQIQTLEADAARHVKSRQMGSGEFRLETQAGKRSISLCSIDKPGKVHPVPLGAPFRICSFLVGRGDALAKLDSFLKQLRQ